MFAVHARASFARLRLGLPARRAIIHQASPGLGSLEFTIAPYKDVPELGFQKSDKFCMLTLRFSSRFDDTTEEEQRELSEQKRQRRAAYIESLFDEFDKDASGRLNKDELTMALARIGLPHDAGAVHGMIHRQDVEGDGKISKEEWPKVVAEAWGSIPDMKFCNRLGDLYGSSSGHEPLDGNRACTFLGRASPVGWALRCYRNIFPYALQSCQLMRNTEDNPDFDPAKMESWLKGYEGDGAQPVLTVEELAHVAAEQKPAMKGGLVVQIIPVDPIENKPDNLYVPLRGLPQNGPKGFFSGWFGS